MTSPVDVSRPDYRMQEILTDIEKARLETIRSCEFVEQDVYLDGRHFNNCIFRACRIIVKLGHFQVTGNIHFESCSFDLKGPAAAVKTIIDALAKQGSR